MKRWAPLTGVAFVVLLVISFILSGSTPDPDDPAQKVVSFYNDHDSKEIVSAVIGAYAMLFFVFFAGVLRATLRRTEPDPATLSTIAFGGGILVAVGGLIFAALSFTLGDLADKLDPSAMQALNALSGDFFFPLAVGTAIFLIASGIATVRGGLLPNWLGWAGIVIGVLAVTPVGFFAFLASLVWVLVTAIILATVAEPATESPGAAVP
jgi:hypothetical protein